MSDLWTFRVTASAEGSLSACRYFSKDATKAGVDPVAEERGTIKAF